MASVPGTHASVDSSSAPQGAPSGASTAGPVVSVVMGSDSDWNVMSEASVALTEFGIRHEVEVVSAHRTPKRMIAFGSEAASRGIRVIIAGAGGAAHLPGMIASLTTLPVVGVPIQSKTLSGVDSLLSIAQMPPGVPVATVAIGNSKNAALLAVQILALSDPELNVRLGAWRQVQTRNVEKASLDERTVWP